MLKNGDGFNHHTYSQQVWDILTLFVHRPYLHDSDCPESDAWPVYAANNYSSRHQRAQPTDQQVGPVQHPHKGAGHRELDDIVGATLGTWNAGGVVPLLFLVDPALDAHLVHPLGRPAAPTQSG